MSNNPGRQNPPPNPAWLARRVEPALEPDLPIIDPHHHVWDVLHQRYLFDELLADTQTGHRIEATVMVEAKALFRKDGPEEMRTVGEAEIAAGIAAMSETGLYGRTRLCAGIVAHADLTLGARVEPVLEALERAGGGRFRGIRHNAAQDEDVRKVAPPEMLRDATFQQGFARLQAMGYRFDAWMYHTQLDDLLVLMRAFPESRVVLNHLSGRIGIGRFAGRGAETFAAWKRDISRLKDFPNFHVKIGGLGMFFTGWGFHERPEPPSSDELAAAWSETVHTAIDIFGPQRCMFESNFPVDKITSSYAILWNAFKKMTRGYTAQERAALFHDTAAQFYAIRGGGDGNEG